MSKQPTVFISSTCYDLLDVRDELFHYLKKRGFLVRLSEIIGSDFLVNGNVNSIETCLINVEQSDIVVCIIDKRYGTPLPGPYDNKSATHTEILHARKKKKKILYFIREKTQRDCDQYKNNSDSKLRHIEIGKYKNGDIKEQKLTEFISENIQSLKETFGEEYSNWIDWFNTSVDLKQMVYSRLINIFKQNSVILAMAPERFLYVDGNLQADRGTFTVSWESTAVVTNVKYGLRTGGSGTDDDVLLEQQNRNIINKEFPIISREYYCSEYLGKDYLGVWCEYSNLHDDRYRIEIELEAYNTFTRSTKPWKEINDKNSSYLIEVEKVRELLFVLVEGEWHKVMDSKDVDDNIPIPTITP